MMIKRTLPFIVMLLSILLSIWLISVALSDIFEKSKEIERINNALRLNPFKSSPYYYIGLIKHYDRENPDLKDAIRLYKKALLKNPLYDNVWYNLAYAFIGTGNKDKAFSAIKNYYRLNHSKSEGIWNTALFYYIHTDNIDGSIQYIKRLVSLYPREIKKVFNILILSGVKNEYILSNILSLNNKFYIEYLEHLMKLNELKRAINYWHLANHDFFDKKSKIRFCNYLLSNESFDEIDPLWKEISNKDDPSSNNLVFNGSFEYPLIGGCLSWVKQKKEGVLIYRDIRESYDEKASLHISFDGRHNPNLHAARQIILVEPDTEYTLSGMIKTDNITTTNGLFLQVYGFKCKGLNIWTDTITGTNDWTQLTRSFKVPSDCRAIVVAVRRAKSYKFNNKIRGTAWVDNIKLTKMEKMGK